MQKVAFFDIDGTVFRSSLLIEIVEVFIKDGVFPNDAERLFQDSYSAWLHREGTYESYIEDVINVFMKYIQGVHYGKLVEVGKKVVAHKQKRVYRYTRDLILDLKSKDYFVVAISQSPKVVLDLFCEAYGFDKVYGRIYEIGPRDLFTGVVTDLEFIRDKSAIVERVFEKEDVTPEGSIGVGDTDGDIPLLKSVEMPICFNPNMALYTHAKENHWPIVVERKDVVYTI